MAQSTVTVASPLAPDSATLKPPQAPTVKIKHNWVTIWEVSFSQVVLTFRCNRDPVTGPKPFVSDAYSVYPAFVHQLSSSRR